MSNWTFIWAAYGVTLGATGLLFARSFASWRKSDGSGETDA
jgi:hypothetical protein